MTNRWQARAGKVNVESDMKDLVQDLVHEVSKERPNLSKVKVLVKKFDIQFSQDPIEQMSLVLERFNSLKKIGLKDSEL